MTLEFKIEHDHGYYDLSGILETWKCPRITNILQGANLENFVRSHCTYGQSEPF